MPKRPLVAALLLLSCTVSCGTVACAARAPVDAEPPLDNLLDRFMAQVQAGRTDAALDALLQRWVDADKDDVAKQRSQLAGAARVNAGKLGALVGTEKVRSCHVGSFLYKAQYVTKHERGLVFWNFTFYNPGTGWTVQSYRFDNTAFVPLGADCNFAGPSAG